MRRASLVLLLGVLGACGGSNGSGGAGGSGTGGNGGGSSAGGGSSGGGSGSGGGGSAGGTGSGGGGGSAGGTGSGGGGGSVGGHTPNPIYLPKPTGTCPDFADGNVTFAPAGIAPRSARVWMSSKAATMHGPLVFYWYATTSSTLEVLYGLGQSIVNEIEDQGGIVVAPVEDEPNGVKNMFPWYLVTGNQMDDIMVADEIVACAIQKLGIDVSRIHSMGMSAGALQTTRMSFLRSGYLASVATYSGGIEPGVNDAFQDATNKYPAMIFHGGPTDDIDGLDFQMASQLFETTLRGDGHFAFICDHTAVAAGHMIPPPPAPASVWQFFQDHPFGTNPSPYANGLPSGFLSYCSLQ